MRFKWPTACGILLLIAYQAMAQASYPNASCLQLGPKPSFIIQLKHAPPTGLTNNTLRLDDFQNLAVPNIQFTHAKRMSHGYVILQFEPKAHTLLQVSANKPACYSEKALSKIIDAIKQWPEVLEVTPNFLSSVMEIPLGDTHAQWNLQAPPGGIDVEHTWFDFTMGQPHVTIAVLDTGILNHEALNQNTLPGVHFTNAGDAGLSATPSCIECAGANHGTLVAGIIAATGELAYNKTLFGVAPHSTILPVNVFTKFTDEAICGFPPCIYSYLSDQINALHWLAGESIPGLPQAEPTVGINMSLGTVRACPEVAFEALNQVFGQGISVIVAAGNQNSDVVYDYPANCSNVISVAAIGAYGERAAYSNWGKGVTIAAPGGNDQHCIYSASHDGYLCKQGTSLAAPHVSGVIALLYALDPTLDAKKIKELITTPEMVTPFPAENMLPPGKQSCIALHAPEQSCGAGIINAYKSLQGIYHG